MPCVSVWITETSLDQINAYQVKWRVSVLPAVGCQSAADRVHCLAIDPSANTHGTGPKEHALNMRDLEPGNHDDERARGPDPGDTPERSGIESTQVRPTPTAPRPAEEQTAPVDRTRPLLGLVIIYSETHEMRPAKLDSRLGRVYPLRDGDVLFLGRHPAPPEVLRRNGSLSPPTFCHLFPHGEPYGYISRRHLTVEMDGLGGAVLTDHSRYGLYLEKAARMHRRTDPAGPPETHRVDGEETVTLMDDLGDPTDRDLDDRRSQYRLRILPAPGSATRAATKEPS